MTCCSAGCCSVIVSHSGCVLHRFYCDVKITVDTLGVCKVNFISRVLFILRTIVDVWGFMSVLKEQFPEIKHCCYFLIVPNPRDIFWKRMLWTDRCFKMSFCAPKQKETDLGQHEGVKDDRICIFQWAKHFDENLMFTRFISSWEWCNSCHIFSHNVLGISWRFYFECNASILFKNNFWQI